jgi:surface protein
VAFYSDATDLVVGDNNNKQDIFVRDTQSGITYRASVNSDGSQANGHSGFATISSDGSHVVFGSEATNLVEEDYNRLEDVFMHDLQTGVTIPISRDASGAQSDGNSGGGRPSQDGTFIAFYSQASNLVPGFGGNSIYVKNSLTGTIVRLGSFGLDSLSASGRFVGTSTSLPLVPNTNGQQQAYVVDSVSGGVRLASAANGTSVMGNRQSARTSLSQGGRYVAFSSSSSNLVSGDTNFYSDIFVRDLQTNTTKRVSVNSNGQQAFGDSGDPSISASGRYVAFGSGANLADGDTGGNGGLFVHDRVTGSTVRVDVNSNGVGANDYSVSPSISGDGRYVVFYSMATNLDGADTNGVVDVYMHELAVSNEPPEAIDWSGSTSNTTAKIIELTGNDPEDDDLLFTIEQPPSNGTLTGTAPNLLYTPNPNFKGSDTFTFSVTDGDLTSSVGIASITVIDTTNAVQIPVSVGPAGANPARAPFLTDTLEDGELDLTTSWNNDGNTETSWFTLDLGEERTITLLKVATRGDLVLPFSVWLGSSLEDGRVPGDPVAECTSSGTDSAVPSHTQDCHVFATGRYLTIDADRNFFRVHGIEVWGTESSNFPLIPTSVANVGANPARRNNLIDALDDGSQNLGTAWRNDATLSTAWFTLDLGSEQSVYELRIAPRGDANYDLPISVGNVLTGGKVAGGIDTICTRFGSDSAVPTYLHRCYLSASGRYVTVQGDRARFRFHGIEVYGEPAGDLIPQPFADYAFEFHPETLSVDFDASASSDPGGFIASYSWDFGDGTTGSGPNVSHQYSSEGQYRVTLTVTNDRGVRATKSLRPSVYENGLTYLGASLEAVGTNETFSARINDRLGTAQNLATSWSNNGIAEAAWFTLDLGRRRSVDELRIAPRGDRNYDLVITIGDTLANGQVPGPNAGACSFLAGDTQVPTTLQSCKVAGAGRFVTVRENVRRWLTVHGVEVLGGAPAPFTATYDSSLYSGEVILGFLGQVDVTVDWGDGSTETFVTPEPSHVYATPGIYTVSVVGTATAWTARNCGGGLMGIDSWGQLGLASLRGAFAYCGPDYLNLEIWRVSVPNNSRGLERVTDMSQLFLGTFYIPEAISGWDVFNVTDMSEMFAELNDGLGPEVVDLSAWDTSHVTSMRAMFRDAWGFPSGLASWDTSNVVDMSEMFRGPDPTLVMEYPDISGWNTSSVTTMREMFRWAGGFSHDLGDWDTSSVTDMSRMFEAHPDGGRAKPGHIDRWDTSRVTDMSWMFRESGAPSGIGNWNTSNVTDMSGMFYGSFGNADVATWDVSNVTDMRYMFKSSGDDNGTPYSLFNQDLSDWCVEQIPAAPEGFDSGAVSWVLPRPNWGAPCGN